MEREKVDHLFMDVGSYVDYLCNQVESTGSIKIKDIDELKKYFNELQSEYKDLSDIEASEMYQSIFLVVHENMGLYCLEEYNNKKELVERIQSGQLFGHWKLFKEIEINL